MIGKADEDRLVTSSRDQLARQLFGETACVEGVGSIRVLASAQHDVATIRCVRADAVKIWSMTEKSAMTNGFQFRVVVLTAGSVGIRGWRRDRQVGAGDILVLPGWTPFQCNIGEAVEIIMLDVPAWWAVQEMIPGSLTLEHFVASNFVSAGALMCLVKDMLRADLSPELQSESLKMFGGLLKSSLASTQGSVEHIPGNRTRMGRLLPIMIRNLSQEGFSPHDAARELKCSVRTLHKTCSDHGSTFNHILINMRLGWAAHRLMIGNERISEVAFGCGFTSLSHFCRQFKMYFGVSARKYRG